jgi:tetraacyldisaccharide 4'-kinase
VPFPLGLILAPIYGAAVSRRNRAFDRGRHVRSAPIAVVSIGNITVGGVGKSPMVRQVAKMLKMAGRRPGIVLRGYKAQPGQLSDEHAEHRALAPDVPVSANPNRYEAIAQLLTTTGAKPDVVILDDGFQHRRLRRNFDLVLVDATQSPFRDRLLPAGWLREPVESLARASAVVVTRADQVADSELRALRDAVERVTGTPPIAETRHGWAREMHATINARETTKPASWLSGRSVVVTCALGHPAPFVGQVRTSGAAISDEILLRDHAPFSGGDVDRIIRAARDADAIVCTAKDWTKLARVRADRWPCPVLRPIVEIEFLRGREELAERLAASVEKPRRAESAAKESDASHDAA